MSRHAIRMQRLTTTIRRWLLLVFVFGIARAGEPLSDASELHVRLATASRHRLRVLGVDAGEVRLRPSESDTGELVFRLEDLRDLQFELPEAYGRAQQLAFQQQPQEALRLLEPVCEPLLPFVLIPGTNASPVVQSYLDLLLAQREWDAADSLVERLPETARRSPVFAGRVLRLAHGLRAEQRTAEATTLVLDLCVDATGSHLAAIERFAHELRRDGAWEQAAQLYERMPLPDDVAARSERRLLQAYLMARQTTLAAASSLLAEIDAEVLPPDVRPLYGLLRGREHLETGATNEALDALSHALVFAQASSEWRVELQVWLANAYRAVGRTHVAMTLESDLQRLHTASRSLAVASGGNTPAEAVFVP